MCKSTTTREEATEKTYSQREPMVGSGLIFGEKLLTKGVEMGLFIFSN